MCPCSFAWYQSASLGLTAKGKTANAINVQTETDKIELTAADLPFDQLFNLVVAEDSATENKGLELAHYNGANTAADTTHKLGTGYIDGAGTFHESATLADGTNNVLAKKFNVTITMKSVSQVTDSASNVWTLSDALAKINDQNFKIYVDADSKTGERARVFNSTAAETTDGEETPTYNNIVQINSGNKAISDLITESAGTYSKKADASLTYSFWVYVWGKETGDDLTADTAAISGSVRVTVANAADSAPAAWDSSAA